MDKILKTACVGCVVLLITLTGCKKEAAPAGGSDVKTPNNLFFVVEPGVGMGNVRFGMAMDEVKTVLGQPDRTTGGAFEYLSQGMAVLKSGGDGKVGAILCGDTGGPGSPLVKACRVRTDKGIGMGSTQKDIVAAYGPPAGTLTMGSITTLSYPSLPASFDLREGKVIHMTFKRK